MEENFIKVLGNFFYWEDMIWPLVIFCMTFTASFVGVSFTSAKNWLGRVARAAFLLWVFDIITWYTVLPQDQVQYLFLNGYNAWYDLQGMFFSGIPGALLWISIGMGVGILFGKTCQDLWQYFRALVKLLGKLPKIFVKLLGINTNY